MERHGIRFDLMNEARNTGSSERELVKQAATDPAFRSELKSALLPHVRVAVRKYMTSRGMPVNQEATLVEIGMKPFEFVFYVYLKNGGMLQTREGHFYEYYMWWMRQAITDFLNSTI